jgi:hypothetical protein
VPAVTKKKVQSELEVATREFFFLATAVDSDEKLFWPQETTKLFLLV